MERLVRAGRFVFDCGCMRIETVSSRFLLDGYATEGDFELGQMRASTR